jgi:cell division initiation protein
MKLTPLDIHHKEFRRSLRGYSEEEVDAFLDQVADEFERIFKENIDLAEKIEQANERVRGYQAIEATLNNTLLQAQRSAEEIVAKSGVEADTMLRDAELKSKEIVHGALQKKQQVANELVRIKHAEDEFRARFKAALESQLRDLSEITLPDDVTVLLDDSDGLVGSVDVRPMPAPREAVSAPAAAPEAEPDPMLLSAPADGVEPGSDNTMAMPAVEPPKSGFVTSVALGEVEAPEMPVGPVELVEPGEFELPGFASFGEREGDSDIEEID